MKTRHHKIKKKEYGIGGAVMTLGKNLLQGKKFGSGALKGVLRAGITPGSGISAGIGLAGAGLSKIGEKTGREGLQKLGKGVGMAGNIAGMFTGGGGGAGAAGALGKGGIDTFLHGAGKQVQGGVLPFLAQKFMKGNQGMKVPYNYGGRMKVMKKGGKMYEDGGELDVNDLLEALEGGKKRKLNKLLNQEYREDVRGMEMYGDPEADAEHFEKDAAKDNKIFKKNTLSIKSGVEGDPELGFRGEGLSVQRDVNKLLDNLEDPQGTRDRQQILKQLALMLATAGAGSLVGAGSNSMRTSPWARLLPGVFGDK